jgi:hypothetical protein
LRRFLIAEEIVTIKRELRKCYVENENEILIAGRKFRRNVEVINNELQ